MLPISTRWGCSKSVAATQKPRHANGRDEGLIKLRFDDSPELGTVRAFSLGMAGHESQKTVYFGLFREQEPSRTPIVRP